MWPPMYTMIISDTPMASGAPGVPFSTVRHTVNTRKKVPMHSVIYSRMVGLLVGAVVEDERAGWAGGRASAIWCSAPNIARVRRARRVAGRFRRARHDTLVSAIFQCRPAAAPARVVAAGLGSLVPVGAWRTPGIGR